MLIFFNGEYTPSVFVRERHVNFKRVSVVPPVVDPNDYQFRVSRVERVRILTKNAGSSPQGTHNGRVTNLPFWISNRNAESP